VARVVIAIDGDASGAEQALEQTKDGIEDLDSSTSKASQGFGRLNTGLVNFTAGANLISMGIQGLRSGIDILWESTERFFQSSEDGQEKWEALERQGRALKGLLFELFIGTSDQNEAFERMGAMLGDLVAAGRGAIRVLQPLANLMRGALSIGARAIAAAFGEAGSMTTAFADATESARDELAELQALLAQQNDTISESLVTLSHYGRASARTVAESGSAISATLGGWETFVTETTRGADEATREFIRQADLILENATSIADLDVPVRGVFEEGTAAGMRVVVREVDSLADAMAGVVLEIEGRQMSALDAYMSQLTFATTLLDEENAAQNRAEEAIRSSSRAREEAVETFGGLGGAMGMTSMIAFQLATDEAFLASNIEATTAAANERLMAEKIAARDRLTLLAEEMLRKDEAAKVEEATLLRMDALKEALDAKEEAREAKRSARVKTAQKGFEVVAGSATRMATQMVKTGKQSREETQKMIGDELVALGAAGVAKAAMMLFTPGQQGLAAGLLAASITAMALGAKMGASAGAGGGPAAPASTQQPQSVTNVTFQNNFAQIGSREAFLRTTGDTFQQAVDEGYIAIPRGRG
jgi:hypothetical protein